MKSKALLIGVSEYLSSSINNLPICKNDIKEIKKNFELQLKIKDKDISVIGDKKNPDRNGILRILNSVESLSNDLDLLIIYFTGHGVSINGESYILTSDSEPDLLSDTAIPIGRIRNLLKKSKAKNKLLIVDSCFSGVNIGKSGQNNPNIGKEFEELLSTGWTIFSSCKGDEFSWFYDEKNLSVFTYFIIQGINGEAFRSSSERYLTLESLSLYVTKKVAEWGIKNSKTQTPTIQSERIGSLVLPVENPQKEDKNKDLAIDNINKNTLVLSFKYNAPKQYSTQVKVKKTNLLSNMYTGSPANRLIAERSLDTYKSIYGIDPMDYEYKTEWHDYEKDERIEKTKSSFKKTINFLSSSLIKFIYPSEIKYETNEKVILPFGIIIIDKKDEFSYSIQLKVDHERMSKTVVDFLKSIDSQNTIIWDSLNYEFDTQFDFDKIIDLVKQREYFVKSYDIIEKTLTINISSDKDSELLMTFINSDPKSEIQITEENNLREEFFDLVPIDEMIKIFQPSFNENNKN